jgi:hypothetical protein
MPEKVTAKNASMPSQHTPVATADGSSLRHGILPGSSSHIVNHQKQVNATRATIANTNGPAARTGGPTKADAYSHATNRTSQISARGRSFVVRPSRPKTRW